MEWGWIGPVEGLGAGDELLPRLTSAGGCCHAVTETDVVGCSAFARNSARSRTRRRCRHCHSRSRRRRRCRRLALRRQWGLPLRKGCHPSRHRRRGSERLPAKAHNAAEIVEVGKNGRDDAYMAGDLARNIHLARAAGSARHRPEMTAPYNARLAVDYISKHERLPSSPHTMATLSILIYCSKLGGFLQILHSRDDGQHAVVHALML